ncbi:MAG: iron-sulfur cluster repair di-iron protein [Gaiellales bacterium]
MARIDPETTVAALTLERPQRTRLFEQLGLDYCCGGERSLAEACAAHGLDLNTVLVLLAGEAQTPTTDLKDWSEASIPDLVDHIVNAHHTYLREELPRLSELSAKVAAAHGAEHPELVELARRFEQLRSELEEHLELEESVTFPAARALASGEAASPGDLDGLLHDHREVGAALEELRERTAGYDAEQALCGTHRALLTGLHELEVDIHEHVHEENNILFPRIASQAQTNGH